MNFVRTFLRAWNGLQNAVAVVAGVLFWVLMLIVNYEVGSRYLGRPTVWVSEISSILVLFLPFLIAGWVLREEGHVKMDLLVERFSPRIRAGLQFYTSLLGFLVMLVVAGAGVMTTVSWIGNRTPTMLMLPRAPIVAVIPLGCFFLSVQFLIRALASYGRWKALRSPSG